MIVTVLLFILGLLLLIKGGDWFVDGAVGIAKRFKVPELLIGATVVSIGTTLPEVLVSTEAAIMSHGEIAYGNAIGSIICNASLICAITIAIRPGDVDRKVIIRPVLFFFGSAVFYSLVAYISGTFSRLVGIILLLIFAVYMFVTIKDALRSGKNEKVIEQSEAEQEQPLYKDILLIVIGAACIAFGADLLVDNGTLIAEAMGVPESVIGLTMVALGTSLPELVTAITSLVKGHGLLSLGNIIGANLFNLVLVSGLATTLGPFDIPSGKLIAGMNASLVIDIPLMFIIMGILTIPTILKGKLRRWQGIVMLVIYIGYITFQFVR